MLTFKEMMEADIHPSGYVLRCMVCRYLTDLGNCLKIDGFFRSIPLYICDKAWPKVMSNREIREIVTNIILNTKQPFNTTDLFTRLQEFEIENKDLVLDTLDNLCECGLVDYREIDNDCWAFITKVRQPTPRR